ncbi:unnamed protein product [Acanthoscelides obtectus]|uniref:Uncharacterized protein n=1 Tax=Acanthoscelides obtectus TaxID=200917 RepID=A0A9P0MG44_ACAOB|nr:unnamed protein product [Acanthoscelides obtectus]CAK1633590.1 hypothetical protein AOBTE_LOCUS8241 [Acanthoscelides obtectus]
MNFETAPGFSQVLPLASVVKSCCKNCLEHILTVFVGLRFLLEQTFCNRNRSFG